MRDIKRIEEIVAKADYFTGVIQIKEKDEALLHMVSGYRNKSEGLLNEKDTALGYVEKDEFL